MTLTFELDLDSVKMNQYVKCLGELSSTACPQKTPPPKYNAVVFKILGKHQ